MAGGEVITNASVKTGATARLVEANVEFLSRYAPFDRMKREHLVFLAGRMKLAYFDRDALISVPTDGPPADYYLIQSGRVASRRVNEGSLGDEGTLLLDVGEGFPVGALTARRATTRAYVAVEDVFCFQVAAEDFHELMRRSRKFQLFCTQHIASLLEHSRRQLQSRFSQRAAEQQAMTRTLGGLTKRRPVTAAPATPLRQACTTMAECGVGSLVVVGPDDRAVGIFTQSDILRRVVLGDISLDRPIGEVMSPSPFTLPRHATVYDAMMAMATHGIRHILIVGASGQVEGVISERDLFALQRVGLRQLRGAIESAGDLETLRQAGTDVRHLALNLLAQGVAAEQLTQFISTLNDLLTRRLIELNLRTQGLWPLPGGLALAWLAFGSEGRHEQTFSTDQDNGIIFECPGEDVTQRRAQLLAMARGVNQDLAACGFPLCKGNIMAGNPEWCLTAAEWERKFGSWVLTPQPKALLNASIFFDFRGLWGEERLAEVLRRKLLAMTGANPLFLKMMAANALETAPPLGTLRDFTTGDDGMLDLKASGARLFVDAARILALRNGIAATNTAQRLRLAGNQQGIAAEELDSIIEAFHFIQSLRLHRQHLDDAATGQPDRMSDNRVSPDALTQLDRRILKESMRQARRLQQRLKLDYQL